MPFELTGVSVTFAMPQSISYGADATSITLHLRILDYVCLKVGLGIRQVY
jgi:hypothetical protein